MTNFSSKTTPAGKVIASAAIAIMTAILIVAPGQCKGLFSWFSSGDEAKKVVKVTKEKRANDRTWITGKTLIKAPPEVVWKTVHEERQRDPDLEYSKVLEKKSNNTCRIEQKFKFIPVIGSATCEMTNQEVPLKRIDYKMVRSDRFKAMEGSWVLTPTDDGRSTMLELSTHIDMGLPVPSGMMHSITSKKLAKRLGNVKRMAESTHRQIAQKGLKKTQ